MKCVWILPLIINMLLVGDGKAIINPETSAALEFMKKGGERGGNIERDHNLPGNPVVMAYVVNKDQLPLLRKFPHLRIVRTWPFDLSHGGAENLKDLTGLRELYLSFTRVRNEDLKYLKGMTQLEILELGNCDDVSSAGLEYLAGLKRLIKLNLRHTGVDDTGLEHLKALTQIEKLDMRQTKVKGPGLQYLKEMKQLQILNLSENKISGSDLRHLAKLTGLQKLYLDDTGVDDAGLKHIGGLTKIEDLSIGCKSVNDVGLTHLSGMVHLKRLGLGSSITDTGLEHLKAFKELNDLAIQDTQVTDVGLRHLKGLHQLKRLVLSKNNKVTDAGIAELQQAIPGLKIERW